MLYAGLKPDNEEQEAPSRHSFLKLAVAAFGTSIDAMAVGISLAFIEVNILLAAGLIGLATTIMVTLGVMLGKLLGSLIGHKAEMFGGLMLIAIGGWIVTFMRRERSGGEFESGVVATGFWTGIAVGRLVLGFATPRIGEKLAVLVCIFHKKYDNKAYKE